MNNRETRNILIDKLIMNEPNLDYSCCAHCGAPTRKGERVKLDGYDAGGAPVELIFHWECFWAAKNELTPYIRRRVAECR